MHHTIIKNNDFFFTVTMAIVVVTSIVTFFQFAHPEVLSMLRRDPEGLASGEWWRMITPLLVHADGWGQYIFNIACIAIKIGRASCRERVEKPWAAEDGIRDGHVTGVQTCALPI